MVWAIVSSQSCFCWLYRVSPSSATKNIINLILVLTIWWCPCVKQSILLLEQGICYDQCILLGKLLAFVLPHFVFQGQICLLLQVSLDVLLLHFSPLWWKGHLFFFLVLILEDLVGVHRTILIFKILIFLFKKERKKVKVAQSCLTLCNPMDSSWNSLGQNTRVGSLSLFHQIFPTQESNQCLLHCRWILSHLSYQGSPLCP